MGNPNPFFLTKGLFKKILLEMGIYFAEELIFRPLENVLTSFGFNQRLSSFKSFKLLRYRLNDFEPSFEVS